MILPQYRNWRDERMETGSDSVVLVIHTKGHLDLHNATFIVDNTWDDTFRIRVE